VVIGAIVFRVLLAVKVVVVNFHAIECPDAITAIVVELLRNQDVVQAFACALVDVGVVDIALGAVLLQVWPA